MATPSIYAQIFNLTPSSYAGDAREIRVRRGNILYRTGTTGSARRILQGAIRLDRLDAEGQPTLAGIATRGDIIGLETLQGSRYTFQATALTQCRLELFPLEEIQQEKVILDTLIRTESRMVAVLNLRIGPAQARVHRLLAMLGNTPIEIPKLRDMADITGLTKETVSRAISTLHKRGIAVRRGRQHLSRIAAYDDEALCA
ncbi:Crp/Fnr family transcriptional regulator [Corticimicrobacter populi]|uniref:Crp/Fnr family transcriptional regulator n=1 Tax=Corticimicrobacter populi TaxID=2175229 RepID=A0A2V1JVH8_9BURK|nr:Crp/Fnr family transcriptional regulator [Corticimicrobacter populi]PWF20864.1 Crp/Fnr family transcriptional regulator [Corticimicrobacter populi]